MPAAKFHIIGNTDLWYRVRVLEEVNAHGLEGTVTVVDENKLAVIVDGDSRKINRLYTDLQASSPSEVVFAGLIYGDTATRKTAEALSSEKSFSLIIELLKEIEKNTRSISQKLSAVLEGSEKRRVDHRWYDDEETSGTKGEESYSSMTESEPDKSVFKNFFDNWG